MKPENHGSLPRVLSLNRDAPRLYRPPADWKQREEFLYIGRANKAHHLADSPFANPYKIGEHGNREQVIARYRRDLERKVAKDTDFREAVKRVRSKRVVCWCAPQACHGDVLVDLAERIYAEEEEEWQFGQILLRLRYDAHILPVLRAWYRYNPTFDPLRRREDALGLWEELVEQGVSVVPEKEGKFFTFVLTTPLKDGRWKSGRGKSDVFYEALVLAWADTFL